jgi:hypothetical protein
MTSEEQSYNDLLQTMRRIETKLDRMLIELDQLKNGEVDTKGALEILGLSPNNPKNTTLLRNLRNASIIGRFRTNGKKYFYDRREIYSVAARVNLTEYR